MLSVIIPAYNEEKYIEACINSLKNQHTATNYEIIVVDNSSTDKTNELAKKTNVKVLSEPRPGRILAKNTGAKNATGDIFCFVDADCNAPNEYLEKISNFFTQNPKVDAVGGPYIYLDGGFFIKLGTQTFNYFYYYHQFIKLLSGFPSLPGGNMAVRKSAFESINGFNEKINDTTIPEDLDLTIRLHKNNLKVVMLRDLVIISSNRWYNGKPTVRGIKRFYETAHLLLKNMH